MSIVLVGQSINAGLEAAGLAGRAHNVKMRYVTEGGRMTKQEVTFTVKINGQAEQNLSTQIPCNIDIVQGARTFAYSWALEHLSNL